jgi:COMPASS component SWD1
VFQRLGKLIARLSDPFTLSHPTAIQTSLFAGALFAKFDPTGRFIAAARNNGSAEIWDLETRAPIRWLDGHVKAVTSIEYAVLILLLCKDVQFIFR